MKHNELKELVELLAYNELESEESVIAENHLLECDECNELYNGLVSLHTALTENLDTEIKEQDLVAARNDLMRTIRSSEQKSSLDEIIENLKELWSGGRNFVYGAAILIVGFLVGIQYSNKILERNDGLNKNSFDISEIKNLKEAGFNFSNISLPGSEQDENNVEFYFEAVKPISFTGNVNDEFTKKLLSAALLNGSNAGVRIRTLNTISSNYKTETKDNDEIRNALITSLKTDENPGVRKEALNVLITLPYNSDIKEALLYVLSNDQNSGLRIFAINALSELRLNGLKVDNDMKSILDEYISTSNNKHLKIQAESLLEGVNDENL